jgi:protein TonB
MKTPEMSPSAPLTPVTGPGVVSTGWLAEHSTYGLADNRRVGAGLGVSFALHAGIFAAIFLVFALTPKETLDNLNNQVIKFVFMQDPGPGGGGGGSQAPAPPKPAEIPKPKPAQPIPVEPPPVVQAPPPPTLNAPIFTPNAQSMQAQGMSSFSLADRGGGGRGQGLGAGRGNGVGEGEGGGTGGGVFRLGSGINNPVLLKEVRPNYTPEAMRLKIQGVVVLEAVILPNGTVGDVKIIKSLDSATGLDAEAIKAAKSWLFRPATRQGQPVPVYATLEVTFRIL